IWIQHFTVGSQGTNWWRVIHPDGTPIAEAELPGGAEPHEIGHAYILASRRHGPLDLRVTKYRLHRTGMPDSYRAWQPDDCLIDSMTVDTRCSQFAISDASVKW